jgi:hypothetical protein
MEHSEAARLMATEKYLLDELSSAEMEAFEEHLFSCEECTLDVRAGAVLLDRAKLELARPAPASGNVAQQRRPRGLWWWRPAFAIPAFAILLVVLGYQNFVTYPALKGAVAENKAPRILPAATLVSSNRGIGPSPILVHSGEPFMLPIDIQAQVPFPSYIIRLQNPAGGVEWSLPVSRELIKDTVMIRAPGVKKPGRYRVVLLGRDAQGGTSAVDTYPLDLQFAAAANP